MKLKYVVEECQKDKWGSLHIFCRFAISLFATSLGLSVGNQNIHLDHLLMHVESDLENVLLIKI